jgi:polyphosphate kinase
MTVFNRELSWLGFNYRVLQEAASPEVPLFERIKFLAIFSSNLDEFFRVRYPAVIAIGALKRKTQKAIVGDWSDDLTEKIQVEILRQLEEFGRILMNDILPALRKEKIHLYYNEPVRTEHKEEVRDLFLSQALSFVQPLLLDGKKHFSPENNQLYLAIILRKPGEEMLRHAVVNIPSMQLPRFFTLQDIEDEHYVIFIDDIIRENIQTIFPGFEVLSVYSFKVTRDAELNLDMQYDTDLLHKIEKQLDKRQFGPPSRFLYENGMPRNLQLFFASALSIKLDELFPGGRYHNLRDLASLPDFGKNLVYKKQEPLHLAADASSGDIFRLISENDVLIHLPYQSYNPILSFFNQAAIDPEVTEIFIALYRVAPESHIANALISAAKNGKKVTVMLELKARFDEANNIGWSHKMKDAGVKLIYGIPGIKVHSKIALVHKKTKGGPVRYSILSTGNFNEVTARFYTDHVLMTADVSIAKELDDLFNFLQKKRLPVSANELKFEKLLVSQFNMIDKFKALIQKEISKAKKGKEALIRIKLNNLEEPAMIEALYAASKAGVSVHLIIRSICCLVPSEKKSGVNITVKRIVDRYLEHSRIFIFGAGEDCEVIMGSADWMTRNLHRRIEVCVPVQNAANRKELVDYFELQWRDNDKAVELDEGMQQQKISPNGTGMHNAQHDIYEYIAGRR